MNPIVPCLWLDNRAEEAARFYTSVFKNAKIGRITRYGKEGKEIHGQEAGTVLTVELDIDGQTFTLLNGGPVFKFNEAVSFQIMCDTQQEIDYYWEKLGQGGDPDAQQCGWLKDKFGLSWQVVPKVMAGMLQGKEQVSDAVMKVLLQMKKLDVAALEKAYRAGAL